MHTIIPGASIQPGEKCGFPNYRDFKKAGYPGDELKKRTKADPGNGGNVGPSKGEITRRKVIILNLWCSPTYSGRLQDGNWSEIPFPKEPPRYNPNKAEQKGDKPCSEMCVPDASR